MIEVCQGKVLGTRVALAMATWVKTHLTPQANISPPSEVALEGDCEGVNLKTGKGRRKRKESWIEGKKNGATRCTCKPEHNTTSKIGLGRQAAADG